MSDKEENVEIAAEQQVKEEEPASPAEDSSAKKPKAPPRGQKAPAAQKPQPEKKAAPKKKASQKKESSDQEESDFEQETKKEKQKTQEQPAENAKMEEQDAGTSKRAPGQRQSATKQMQDISSDDSQADIGGSQSESDSFEGDNSDSDAKGQQKKATKKGAQKQEESKQSTQKAGKATKQQVKQEKQEVKPSTGGAVSKGKPAAAPAQKKEEKQEVIADEQQYVLNYMIEKNRPYSLINICDNLHGKIKKPNLQKVLDKLSDQGELQCQEFGKAKVYLYNQKNIPEVDQEELERMKVELNDKTLEVQELEDQIKNLNQNLAFWTTQLTNDDLVQEIAQYEQMIVDSDQKLEFYQSDQYEQISDETMQKAQEQKAKMEQEYKKRRRLCRDGLKQFGDNLEQQYAQMVEMVGIEEQE